ncbi:MAG TPA: histidine kinase [Bacteroidetes bacterium]|nr:histidine kinase [Bacteroidota bacterium]
MSILKDRSKWEKTFRLLSRPAVYHSLFWVGLLLVFSFFQFYGSKYSFFYLLSNNIIRLLVLGAAVYYNIYYLIPKYLANKKISGYFGLFILTVLILTPIESFLIFTNSGSKPDMQASVLQNLHFAFIPNFFVVGTSTLVKITLDWLKGQREKQELQTQTMQSELRFLKSQINPHFLFNTLNSLYALTLKKSDKAPDIVLKLSEMMRYMLYECNEPEVQLSKEVSYIANYLELEKLRQGKSMDISFKVDGAITDQRIAPLMFIPFIENCFKHGLGNHISKGFVRISLKVAGNEVEARIENSKPESMPKPRKARSGGIGLVNVRRRLDLLYPGSYSLDIEDSPNTYAVRLKILLD